MTEPRVVATGTSVSTSLDLVLPAGINHNDRLLAFLSSGVSFQDKGEADPAVGADIATYSVPPTVVPAGWTRLGGDDSETVFASATVVPQYSSAFQFDGSAFQVPGSAVEGDLGLVAVNYHIRSTHGDDHDAWVARYGPFGWEVIGDELTGTYTVDGVTHWYGLLVLSKTLGPSDPLTVVDPRVFEFTDDAFSVTAIITIRGGGAVNATAASSDGGLPAVTTTEDNALVLRFFGFRGDPAGVAFGADFHHGWIPLALSGGYVVSPASADLAFPLSDSPFDIFSVWANIVYADDAGVVEGLAPGATAYAATDMMLAASIAVAVTAAEQWVPPQFPVCYTKVAAGTEGGTTLHFEWDDATPKVGAVLVYGGPASLGTVSVQGAPFSFSGFGLRSSEQAPSQGAFGTLTDVMAAFTFSTEDEASVPSDGTVVATAKVSHNSSTLGLTVIERVATTEDPITFTLGGLGSFGFIGVQRAAVVEPPPPPPPPLLFQLIMGLIPLGTPFVPAVPFADIYLPYLSRISPTDNLRLVKAGPVHDGPSADGPWPFVNSSELVDVSDFPFGPGEPTELGSRKLSTKSFDASTIITLVADGDHTDNVDGPTIYLAYGQEVLAEDGSFLSAYATPERDILSIRRVAANRTVAFATNWHVTNSLYLQTYTSAGVLTNEWDVSSSISGLAAVFAVGNIVLDESGNLYALLYHGGVKLCSIDPVAGTVTVVRSLSDHLLVMTDIVEGKTWMLRATFGDGTQFVDSYTLGDADTVNVASLTMPVMSSTHGNLQWLDVDARGLLWVIADGLGDGPEIPPSIWRIDPATGDGSDDPAFIIFPDVGTGQADVNSIVAIGPAP